MYASGASLTNGFYCNVRADSLNRMAFEIKILVNHQISILIKNLKI